MTKVKDVLGELLEEDFLEFDISGIQSVLQKLRTIDVPDLAHAEFLQQESLRGADMLSEFLARMVKVTSYLESKVSSVRNAYALNYTTPDGSKVTNEMRTFASKACVEAGEIEEKLAKAKGTKVLLEKKLDILIKAHHHYKDIAQGLKRGIVSHSQGNEIPEGY